MNVNEMHYAFTQKLNRADSQQWRKLRPMEIDWYLNEAQLQFVQTIANPKGSFLLEINQRSIDDISSLVTESFLRPNEKWDYIDQNNDLHEDTGRYVYRLSELFPRFLYFISAEVGIGKKGCCALERKIETHDGVISDSIIGGKKARVFIMRHSDLYQDNTFYNTSWQWAEVAGVFEYITVVTDTTTEPWQEAEEQCLVLFDDRVNTEAHLHMGAVSISYIRMPQMIFFGQYNTLGGELTSSDLPQSCELPVQVHDDIVDIAVSMASSNMMNSDIQMKIAKIQMNNQ